MKSMLYLWRIVQSCMVALMVVCIVNCSEGDDPIGPDPNPDPTPPNEEVKTDVSFTINNEGGSGTGTTSSPAEVAKGDTLNMTISQKSSYTDTDGTVFTCEPKATIELFAKMDTVYVKDKSLLTDVKANSEIKTSQSGTSPIRNVIDQKFQIGDSQYINFDLAYEMYKYKNKAGKTVDMPYIKLNQAKFGSSDTTKTRATIVPEITLTPITNSRSVIVKDTAMYEVNAVFSLELESVNTSKENKQVVTFSVGYVGVVTEETEYPDPASSLSAEIDVEGTSSTSSPYAVNLGEKLSLLLKQTSSYTDSYSNVTTCKPEAIISIGAKSDVVYASSKSELVKTPSTDGAEFTASGENPIVSIATQLIKVGTQNIQLDMSYEAYTAEDVEKNVINMPYYKLSSATVGAVTASDSTFVKGELADTTYYNISVPVQLEAVSVNATEESKQSFEFVVAYRGAIVEEVVLPDPVSELSGKVVVEGGTSSTSSPYTVNLGETLSLLINQTSMYTDEYSSTTTCKPVASISLWAKSDVIYVNDKSELEVSPTAGDVKFTANGKNPIVHSATQMFTIGEQRIQLDMAYEACYSEDSKNQTVAMPYYKLKAGTIGNVSVGNGVVVNGETADTTYYEVSVPIKLIATSVYADNGNEKLLEFIVKYRGATIEEVTLPDPETEFSSEITIDGTSVDVSAPIDVNAGKTLSLVLKQTIKYTDSYSNVTTYTPEASISIGAQDKVVFADKKEDLDVTPSVGQANFTLSGNNPILYSASQSIGIGKQKVKLNLSYEAYSLESRQASDLPYLKLNAATAGDVTISNETKVSGTEADTTYYDVSVPVELDVVSVNTPQENKQTLVFVMNYRGAVVTANEITEPELVKMEYRPGWTWEEAHDNLPLLYYAHVDCDRYYSNGEVYTDHFVDYGHDVLADARIFSRGDNSPEKYPAEGVYIFPNQIVVDDELVDVNDTIEYILGDILENDSIRIMNYTVKIGGTLSLSNVITSTQNTDRSKEPGDWENYVVSKLYTETAYNQPNNWNFAWMSFDPSTTANGWYFANVSYSNVCTISSNGIPLLQSYVDVTHFDQFLVIDGHMVDFTDYYPDRTDNVTVEDIAGGKKVTHECTVKYLGRNFYSAVITNIYQR